VSARSALLAFVAVLGVLGIQAPAVAGQPLETLAYTHGTNGTTIDVMRSDGSGDRQLIAQPRLRPRRACGPQIADMTPAWSRDGRRIAWVRYGCALRRDQRGVWIANADGSGAHRVVWGFAPSWSPDGKRLVLDRPTTRSTLGVFVVNTDGSGLMLIADEAGNPSWSADGSTIVMVSSGPHVGGGLAYVAPDGSNRQETGVQGTNPDWSPDGKLVAYDGFSPREIRTLDFVTGMTVELTSDRFSLDSRPAWSPDGTRIAFVEQRRIGRHTRRGVYVINADGSNVVRLRNGIDPAWRPHAVSTSSSAPAEDERAVARSHL
jgi:Tol biopolymer transport system component